MLTVVVLAAACASRPFPDKLFVETQHEADVDFGVYLNYAWLPDDRRRANPVFAENPPLADMIVSAVDRELAIKGFDKTPDEAADFLITISARAQDVTVASKHRYQGWSHGYARSALASVNTATQLDKRVEGTLILEIIDVASEGVVWRARAAGVIARRDDIEKAVEAAVTRMLAEFPPES